jgi:competence protein ComEA
MVRLGGGTDLDDRAAGPARLQSMRLRPGTGWVPESASLPLPQPIVAGGDRRTDAEPKDGGRTDGGPRVAVPSAGELAKAWAADRLPLWTHGVVERASVGSVLAMLAAVVAVVMAGVMLLHRHPPSGYSSSYNASTTDTSSSSASSFAADPMSSSAPSTTAAATSIVVDVGGRVRKPGLVTLPPGARVADAIAAAGGPMRRREIVTMNLAAKVTDGQLLLVGVKAAGSSGSTTTADGATPTSPAAPVSLSSATLEQLETLPGVGPVTGQKIIDWRTTHSGFTSVEQLQQVSGIGPATYAELSPLVTP